MANTPRFEAKITIPSGFEFYVNDGGGADTVTVPAQEIWPFDLIGLLETRIELAVGSGFEVTADFVNTGQFGISKDAGTFTLEFDTDEQAELFGVLSGSAWAGAPAASFTSTSGMKGVWIPRCPMFGVDLDLDSQGLSRTDGAQMKGPTGKVFTVVNNEHFSFEAVKFEMLARDRAIRNPSSGVPFTWQDFVRECQLGGSSTYFPVVGHVAPYVRIFTNANIGTVLGEAEGADGIYQLVIEPKNLGLRQYIPGYSGLWTLEIPEIVKV